MRPRDFPDFFQRQPPPGQNRVSSIRLDAQGRFWDGSNLVLHPGMCRAFASWVRRHPGDGRYILENGYDWLYIEVEDTPCFVKGVRGFPPKLTLVLLDESEEEAPRRGWNLRADGSVTVLVRGGECEARLVPSAQTALGPWLEQRDGGFGLLLGDEFVPFEGAPLDVQLPSR